MSLTLTEMAKVSDLSHVYPPVSFLLDRVKNYFWRASRSVANILYCVSVII